MAQSAPELSSALETTARNISPSVVQIFATSYSAGDALVARSGDLIRTERASGSGVIVDPAGYIVTNAHVVRGAGRIRVEVPRPVAGTSILAATADVVGAQVVGMDLEDLAVIKIDRDKLPAIAFADSDELKPGQLVLAFGSPLGLMNSVTLGIVGAVARQLEPESPMVWVQTDASINPGSSGGPLVDLRGRLVGINTSIASQTGGNEGVGFSSPSNIVRNVYEQIKKPPGVSGAGTSASASRRSRRRSPRGLGLARDSGVVVSDVAPGSPAAATGFRPGDIVLTLEGKAMENGRQFQVNLYRQAVGNFVGIEVLRDGQTRRARVPVRSAAIRWPICRRPSIRASTW